MTQYRTKEDLLKKGREAIGKSFGEIDKFNRLSTAKGSLGHVIEESHFGYKINSKSEADFADAGVELKVTPYIRRNNKFAAKERLVLNIINYMEEYKRTFENSSFWINNNSLLIMFYEHIIGLNKKDFRINECILYEYPEEDLLIIQSDWKKIISKIREGKAHEISEADTNFLGACTKGRTAATSFRQQPFSNQKAKQRAYCLKQPYMSYMLDNYIFGKTRDERIIRSPEILKDISFEEYVVSQIKPYFGRTQSSLLSEFGFKTKPKNINELIIARILGVKGRLSQTEEFKKANIVPKTIRVNRSGTITESMSFPSFNFKELAAEEWEESSIRIMFEETRYLFIIFKFNHRNELILHDTMFWGMPYHDLLEVQTVWERTKKILLEGVEITEKNGKQYNNFPKASENRVAHIRPHARNSLDTLELPDGRKMPKQCFWLNNTYILSQIAPFVKARLE